MIKLKQLLDEIALGGKSYRFAMERLFPLAGKIGDKIWDKQRIRGFHFTKPENIAGLKSMSGSRKALSVSTKVADWNIINLSGPVSNGMMVWVEGDVLFKSHTDLGSRPDENGRRWIDLLMLDTQLHNNYTNYLRRVTEYERARSASIHAASVLHKWAAFSNPNDDPNELTKLKKAEKDAKSRFIKIHMDTSWSWLNTDTNLIKMQMYARDVGRRGEIDNNEYIVTNIKPIDVIIFDLERGSDWEQRPSSKEIDANFEKFKRNISSVISGELVIAPPKRVDPSGKVQQKFYKDRFSEDPNI